MTPSEPPRLRKFTKNICHWDCAEVFDGADLSPGRTKVGALPQPLAPPRLCEGDVDGELYVALTVVHDSMVCRK